MDAALRPGVGPDPVRRPARAPAVVGSGTGAVRAAGSAGRPARAAPARSAGPPGSGRTAGLRRTAGSGERPAQANGRLRRTAGSGGGRGRLGAVTEAAGERGGAGADELGPLGAALVGP